MIWNWRKKITEPKVRRKMQKGEVGLLLLSFRVSLTRIGFCQDQNVSDFKVAWTRSTLGLKEIKFPTSEPVGLRPQKMKPNWWLWIQNTELTSVFGNQLKGLNALRTVFIYFRKIKIEGADSLEHIALHFPEKLVLWCSDEISPNYPVGYFSPD